MSNWKKVWRYQIYAVFKSYCLIDFSFVNYILKILLDEILTSDLNSTQSLTLSVLYFEVCKF